MVLEMRSVFVTTAARLMRICCVTTRVLRTTTCASTKKSCVIKRTSQLLPMLEIADVSCLVWCFPVFDVTLDVVTLRLDVVLVAEHHMMSRCMSRLTLHSASCHAAATQWLMSQFLALNIVCHVRCHTVLPVTPVVTQPLRSFASLR